MRGSRLPQLLDEPNCFVDDVVEGGYRRWRVPPQPRDVRTVALGAFAGLGHAGAERAVLLRFVVQVALQIGNALDVTAEKDDVIAGHERAISNLFVCPEVGDGVHLHVVADGGTFETDGVEKIAIQAPAERGRTLGTVDPGIRSVADHDRAGLVAEARKRDEITLHEIVDGQIHHRRAVVWIARAQADSWEMLETRGRTGQLKAADERAGKLDDRLGVAAERAALQTLRCLVAPNVHHRREIDLDVEPAQRHADHTAAPVRHHNPLLPFRKHLSARKAGK